MRPKASAGRTKFEEDIKSPFVSLYSYSTTVDVDDTTSAARSVGGPESAHQDRARFSVTALSRERGVPSLKPGASSLKPQALSAASAAAA
jgi:hypothetical protein